MRNPLFQCAGVHPAQSLSVTAISRISAIAKLNFSKTTRSTTRGKRPRRPEQLDSGGKITRADGFFRIAISEPRSTEIRILNSLGSRHLKFTSAPLWGVLLASWGIAFIEYWLAVPVNRIGHAVYSTAALKTMQEVITLVVFAVFSVYYLRELLTLNHIVGFAFIGLGAFFVLYGPIGR